MKSPTILVALACLLPALSLGFGPVLGDAPGDRSDGRSVIVTLAGGAAFEGTPGRSNAKDKEFETAFGVRVVPKLSIINERPAASVRKLYRQQKQKAGKMDLVAREKLAKWCKVQGLTSGLAEQLEHIFEKRPTDRTAWGIIRQEAPHYRLAGRNPHPQSKSRWTRTQIDLLYRAAAKAKFVRAALIDAQLAALPMDLQLNQAIKHAERGRGPERWIAADLLGRSTDVRRVKTLYKVALGDPIWQVRRMAVQSLEKHDDGTTYRPFVKALLGHQNDVIRMHAAEALGHLGDSRGVPPLMIAMKQGDGPHPAHSNISTLSQVAYVKDYDVEVAQTAFIADPLVDIVVDGMVLDAAVVSVGAQRSTVGRALGRLTSASFGADHRRWSKWWKDNKERYKKGR